MISKLRQPVALAVLALLMFGVTLFALFLQNREAVTRIVAEPTPAKAIDPDFVYWGFRSNEIDKLIEELWTQRESLQEREKQIALEEARMQDERNELERMREEIRTYRKELSDSLIEVEQRELTHLRNEVAIYSNMSPENIVTILRQKDDREIVKLLSLMKPDAVAKIIEEMIKSGEANKDSAGRAARLLEQLKRLQNKKSQG